MANDRVGLQITQWLLANYLDDVALVVSANDAILAEARSKRVHTEVSTCSKDLHSRIVELGLSFDLGMLAWWPTLIKPPLLGVPEHGFVNTHPSLLPYNRGKHYNFWALVEQAPFGVSLHVVEEGIDCGAVISQRQIPYDWTDNGYSLYHKASTEMVQLFKDTYPALRSIDFPRVPQDPNQGSFHLAKELDPASEIDLDSQYRARDLLNLLRARTFPGHPGCWFSDEREEYEVRLNITRRTP